MGFTCEDDYLFSIFNAGYMLGMLTGAFVLGILSDKVSLINYSKPRRKQAHKTVREKFV